MSFKMNFKGKKVNFKSKKAKIGILIAVLVVVIGGVYISKKSKMDNLSAEGMMDFIETYSIPENEKIFINGSIIPKQSKELTLEGGYEISSLNVSNGQSVSKGDVLFTAKSSEVSTQINDLEQQIKDLKNQLGSEVEDKLSINSEISKLNSEIKRLKNKSYITTYAPFSGQVYMNENKASAEEVPSYMTIESNEYYMKGQVSEQDLPKISKNLGVEIYVFATEGKLGGKISSISQRPTTGVENQGDTGGSSALSYYDVYVEFDSQENLTNGFHIQASVEVESTNPKIPVSALIQDEKGYFVYKVVDGLLVKQSIEVESQTDDFAVLTSGLKQKDIIIKVPTDEMKEGDEVPVDSVIMDESSEGNTTDEKVGM